ncbi:hypothetical protein SCHPADRAFT_292005 [Schizopora paradoxa]|uniref:Uncharacterized protein n=1 Tax=Schizopora paradoxa TaxID=27342 RepID=A0A0H2RS10_9AGAM|nr:hypothetical protein SCHPADRAFT_292005 [Schizopora paradoxa]
MSLYTPWLFISNISSNFLYALDEVSMRGNLLAAAGLILFVDLSTIPHRTALTGSASVFDIFLLMPGIHRQHTAPELNGGELPITGAMTTGYIFRIENEATVRFLQSIGKPGHLANIGVARRDKKRGLLSTSLFEGGIAPGFLCLIGVLLTPATLILLILIRDFWAVGALSILMLARLLNVVVIKRRTVKGWKGISEPGVDGDLLTLMSQDRWVRMQGLVDDLKDVTAGQWLRNETTIEGFTTSFSAILVYMSAILAFNATPVGSLAILSLLLSSAGLLGLCNSMTKKLRMFDCVVYQVGEPKKYERRLHMAKELIEESGRDDWAIGMGLIVPPKDKAQLVNV